MQLTFPRAKHIRIHLVSSEQRLPTEFLNFNTEALYKTGGMPFGAILSHTISVPLLGGHFIAHQGRVFAGHANSFHSPNHQT